MNDKLMLFKFFCKNDIEYAKKLLKDGELFLTRSISFRKPNYDLRRRDLEEGLLKEVFIVSKEDVKKKLKIKNPFSDETLFSIPNLGQTIDKVRSEEIGEQVYSYYDSDLTLEIKYSSVNLIYCLYIGSSEIFDSIKYFEEMNRLGYYVVVITDIEEFENRIINHFSHFFNEIKSGVVNYTLHDEDFSAKSEFKKIDPNGSYKYQNEYRYVFNPKKDLGNAEHIKLQIGNLEDIALMMKTEELITLLEKKRLYKGLSN